MAWNVAASPVIAEGERFNKHFPAQHRAQEGAHRLFYIIQEGTPNGILARQRAQHQHACSDQAL